MKWSFDGSYRISNDFGWGILITYLGSNPSVFQIHERKIGNTCSSWVKRWKLRVFNWKKNKSKKVFVFIASPTTQLFKSTGNSHQKKRKKKVETKTWESELRHVTILMIFYSERICCQKSSMTWHQHVTILFQLCKLVDWSIKPMNCHF